MIWVDSEGLAWEVIDWHRPNLEAKAKRLPLSSAKADGRAFVPQGRAGPTMLFEFGRIAYRQTTDRTLQQQLDAAYPEGSTPAERMQRAAARRSGR